METFDFVLKPLHVWYGKMLERTALVVFVKDQLAVLHLALSEQFLIGHIITGTQNSKLTINLYDFFTMYCINYVCVTEMTQGGDFWSSWF